MITLEVPIHLRTTDGSLYERRSACGTAGVVWQSTKNLHYVTCANCIRTKRFKKESK